MFSSVTLPTADLTSSLTGVLPPHQALLGQPLSQRCLWAPVGTSPLSLAVHLLCVLCASLLCLCMAFLELPQQLNCYHDQRLLTTYLRAFLWVFGFVSFLTLTCEPLSKRHYLCLTSPPSS